MTLMTWGNSRGENGRCDARCHNAHELKCDCMCGGEFHGKKEGSDELRQAIEQNWKGVMREANERAKKVGFKLVECGRTKPLF